MSFRRGFVWLPVLIAIVVVMAVSGGAYWYEHSQKSNILSEAEALDTLKHIPEVMTWLADFCPPAGTNGGTACRTFLVDGENPKNGGKPVFAFIEKDSNSFTIHAYEDLPDHASNFGWYTIDRTTGFVTSVDTSTSTKTYPPLGDGGIREESFPGEETQISVPGMSKYTDTDFDFSFWYPSSWTVIPRQPTKAPDTYYPGGTVTKSYNLMDSSGDFAVAVNTVYSSGGTITDTGGAGPFGPVKYFYDVLNKVWMVAYPEGTSQGQFPATTTVSIQYKTMGGLPMLGGTSRFDTSIIPLNAKDFVIVTDGGGANAFYLARTVTALDSSVGADEQIKIIQAEKDAYTTQ